MSRVGFAVIAVLGVVGGCSQQPETIDTSGSHPTFGATAPMSAEAKEAEVDTGRLVVLTPGGTQENPRDPRGSMLTRHSGYTVYTETGHKVAHEANHEAGREGPVERKLAPGRYFVRLDRRVPGRNFWVAVERGRVTRVENRLWSDSPPAVK